MLLQLAFHSMACRSGTSPAPVSATQTELREISRHPIISDSTNPLSEKTEQLTLHYTVWGCACPEWSTVSDFKKYQDSGLLGHSLYLEPAADSLAIPEWFDPFRHLVQVSGQFYVRNGYPKGTVSSEESPPAAKVFRYSKISIINDPEFKAGSPVQTLVLYYSAVSCSCAQWADQDPRAKKDDEPTHYWLEPADEQLIRADTLFNGVDFPVRIRVTGQVVSTHGFPRGANLDKTSPEEAGSVFRYTRIRILQRGSSVR